MKHAKRKHNEDEVPQGEDKNTTKKLSKRHKDEKDALENEEQSPKKQKTAIHLDHEPPSSQNYTRDDDITVSKTRKKKHKKEVTSSEELSGTHSSTPTSKKKKKSEKELDGSIAEESHAVDLSPTNKEELAKVKKSKKSKKKLVEESSLGVIDKDILKQAETNLGLPIADELETQSPVLEQEDNDISVKKEKKKKKKKKDKEAETETPTANEKSRNERVLEYVQQWNTKKETWKFNKMLQVHLLHIMYDTTLVNSEDFETVLLYLDGLSGKGREKTKEEAKKILDREEIGAADAEREERAREIYQILS